MATLPKTLVQNLAQKRALNAIQAATNTMSNVNGGEVVKKIPNLIIESGLLGALAFAIEKKEEFDKKKGKSKNEGNTKKEEGFGAGFNAIRIHLKSIGDPTAKDDIKEWFAALADSSAEQLRMTTSEAMAYLVYLRRFVKKDEKDDK